MIFTPDEDALPNIKQREAIGETYAEAICMAALEAVKGQIIVLSEADANKFLEGLDEPTEPVEDIKTVLEQMGHGQLVNELDQEEDKLEKFKLAMKLLQKMDDEGIN